MENKILATVGGKAITQEDADLILKNIDKRAAAQYAGEQGKENLLNELINQELIYLDALDTNLANDEDYIKEVERVKTYVLKQFAVNKLIGGLTVSDTEIESFYKENQEQFTQPESIRASHILVDTMEEAEEALKELKDGMAFGDAANEYSKCPSNVQGGDLGQFQRGMMVPEFEEAAFALSEIGQLSNIVKTQFGYHIIKLEEKNTAEIQSFDDVKEQIAGQLNLMKQNQVFHSKIAELKSKYPVEIKG